MVDAFSRLFGKKDSKKSTGSTSSIPPMSPSASDVSMLSPGGGHDSTGHTDEDGFTHLANDGHAAGGGGARPPPQPGYPALPKAEETQPPYPTGTMSSQYSVTGGSHALEGVPFALSGRCSAGKGGGLGSEFDAAMDDIMQRMENAKSILQSANYDFQVEKSVVEQT